VSQISRSIEKGTEIDPRLDETKQALGEIQAGIEDTAIFLRAFKEGIQTDPLQLEKVSERLDLLNRLKRKYGETLEEVLQFKSNLALGIENIEGKKAEHRRLKEKWASMETALILRAEALSKARKEAASRLEHAMEKELQSLQMANTAFKAHFESPLDESLEGAESKIAHLREDGFDRVEFMIAPNVGEELRPLARVASGGELSRIMLALKTILAQRGSVETVIFDEVDSGISGATAQVLGEKLLALSEFHQILCITHLPQIASQGCTHFLVSKEVIDNRTQTTIRELHWEQRVMEIARLVGGRDITSSAIAHARELLKEDLSQSDPP
jgi:DNA repair protein RecN (Recombination protein N)